MLSDPEFILDAKLREGSLRQSAYEKDIPMLVFGRRRSSTYRR